MAFTGSPTDSVQRGYQRGATKVDPQDFGRVMVAFFEYTHSAGAGTGEVNLIKLPPGKLRIFTDLSRLICSAMAATADLSIGHRAYTDPEASTPAVVEDFDEWHLDADAASIVDLAWGLPAGGHPIYNTKNGLEIFASITTANIEDTDTISGYVVYCRGG